MTSPTPTSCRSIALLRTLPTVRCYNARPCCFADGLVLLCSTTACRVPQLFACVALALGTVPLCCAQHGSSTNAHMCCSLHLCCCCVTVALKGVVMQCQDGKDIAKICTFGDSVITQQCAKSFKKKKKMEKGIAFPTCLSVNDCICNFSPLANESKTLATGDVVKMYVVANADVQELAVGS